MPRYPSAWLEELRARSDIVQVVSAYVPLKKSGRHHWGLCPFHGEKTASFSVDGERQLFYCFGCKAGGDVFHFVSEIERCSFSEAVQLLAQVQLQPVRLIGTGLYHLTDDHVRQICIEDLMPDTAKKREEEISNELEKLHTRYGLDFAGNLDRLFQGETLYKTVEYMRKKKGKG